MFDKLKDLGGLMQQAQQMQQKIKELQEQLGQREIVGSSGAGMVKVTVNGRMEVVRVRLSDEAARLNDREMLEDLIKAAANQAVEKARQLVAEETAKMATGLGLPPGVNLPGLPGLT